MMGLLNTVLKFIMNNQKLILIALLATASVFAFTYKDKYDNQVIETQKQINNIEALNDSVRTYKNKSGELTSEKLALQTDKEQLKTLNEDLAKELEKERGEVESLTKLVTELQGDTGDATTSDGEMLPSPIMIEEDEPQLARYKFTWEKSNSGDKWSKVLEGYFVVEADSSYKPQIIENKITKDLLNMEIVTGISDDDGQKSIFVRSTYPGLTFTDINGAIIDNDKLSSTKGSRWGIGLGLGYGLNTQTGESSPVLMGGITYDFVRF